MGREALGQRNQPRGLFEMRASQSGLAIIPSRISGGLHWDLFDADPLEALANLGIEPAQQHVEADAQTA
jgi:hypothetical protein